MGLKPENLMLSDEATLTMVKTLEVNNCVLPITMGILPTTGENTSSTSSTSNHKTIAEAAIQNLSLFEDFYKDFKTTEIKLQMFATPNNQMTPAPTPKPSEPKSKIAPSHPQTQLAPAVPIALGIN